MRHPSNATRRYQIVFVRRGGSKVIGHFRREHVRALIAEHRAGDLTIQSIHFGRRRKAHSRPVRVRTREEYFGSNGDARKIVLNFDPASDTLTMRLFGKRRGYSAPVHAIYTALVRWNANAILAAKRAEKPSRKRFVKRGRVTS